MAEEIDWTERDELTKAELAEFKQALLNERDRVLSRLKQRVVDAVGDSSAMPDEGDQAQQLTEQAYMLRLADKEQKLLRQIDRALAKFKTDEYGYCEGTDELINPARLRLRPWTRYSIEYKEQQEQTQRGFAKPSAVSEDPLNSPRPSPEALAQGHRPNKRGSTPLAETGVLGDDAILSD